MAIEKMKYIRIMGPLSKFDEFALKHVINRNIELEPAHKHLNVPGLIPFTEDNSLDNLLKRIEVLNERFQVKIKEYDLETVEKELLNPMDKDEADAFIAEIEDKLSALRKETESINAGIKEREQIIKQILPLSSLDIKIDELFHFTFMKFRFGKAPKDLYNRQKKYLEELDVVVVPVSEEDENIWLSYFMPASVSQEIDNVFATMGFTRVRISDEVKGTPKVAIGTMESEISRMRERLDKIRKETDRYLESKKSEFEKLYHQIKYLSKLNEVKRYCSHSQETFFMIGWIPQKDYSSLINKIDTMDQIVIGCEDPDCIINATPPTIMKNNRFFKPFESLVTMYGLPSAKEVDPTPLLAITFILMFGFMFGDVGQGLIIALLGLVLYKVKKMPLGGVMLYVGISSTVFGFIYGSVFGNEEILKPLWLSPLHSKSNINTILYISVGYGAFIILITMFANIINCIRMRKWGKLLFDKNGLAGLLFYGGIVAVVLIWLKTGKLLLSGITLVIVIVIPTLMLLFKEPLENIILGKEHIMPHEKGMYFVEAGFDIFETLLSFFSGTVSFARVGAFALNHAGLSLAVWTLFGMIRGVGGILVVIIGNVITIGLEGLIVGIQCMRLEFYEMFGRYYIGEGHEFKPVRVTEE
ncbi:MAG TPA: V-type ATP synthase subunit I [Clostridiaceae bacterium]|jgi:V/A-type H+-transporting ATPase subunit I|nr:V-type ATP synthase subunit I [Clostridiaceae bacterium]